MTDTICTFLMGFLGGVAFTSFTLGVYLAFRLTPADQWGTDAWNRICEWRIWGPK